MTFKNTAGAEKHQTVAFRSGSNFSVFYRCKFDAYNYMWCDTTCRAFSVSGKVKPEEAIQATSSSLPDEVVDTDGEYYVSERRRKSEFLKMQEEMIKIDLYNSMVKKEGTETEEEAKKAYRSAREKSNDTEKKTVDDKVSSTLINKVNAMLQKLEKEIDDVDAKIGDRLRLLDRAVNLMRARLEAIEFIEDKCKALGI